MGQTIDKNENIEDLKFINSSLKDYLLLNHDEKNLKNLLNKTNKNHLNPRQEIMSQEALLMLSLSIACKFKSDPLQNCNFNSALLMNRVCEINNNNNTEEEKYLVKQLDITNKINKGRKLFRKVKTVSGKISSKFSNSRQSSNNENDMANPKSNKSEFITLNTSIDRNNQNNTLTQRKNFQNLEISKINTTKTANQTNIIDEDFGFDDYLKTETTRIKNNIKFDNCMNNNDAFQTTIQSKKKDSNLTIQNSMNKSIYNNDVSVESKNNISEKFKKETLKSKGKNSINMKSSINLSTKNNFETNNSRIMNRTPKYNDNYIMQINKQKYIPTSSSPSKLNKTKPIKIEKKPVVNIKIDLRDIVREDIIDSYIQNTNSITNNSNLKNSLSPINTNKYAKAPFASKKPAVTHTPKTPTKLNNFKTFVENCSNPNKMNFHLENAKKKISKPSIIKQKTTVNLNKSRDISKPKKAVTNSKSKPSLTKTTQINKSNDNINKTPTIKTVTPQKKSKKFVCLDISEDGEIIDKTENTSDNLFVSSPENKTKYQFKPRNKPTYNNVEAMNESFGQDNNASFN
jgi:hypothetical protein